MVISELSTGLRAQHLRWMMRDRGPAPGSSLPRLRPPLRSGAIWSHRASEFAKPLTCEVRSSRGSHVSDLLLRSASGTGALSPGCRMTERNVPPLAGLEPPVPDVAVDGTWAPVEDSTKPVQCGIYVAMAALPKPVRRRVTALRHPNESLHQLAVTRLDLSRRRKARRPATVTERGRYAIESRATPDAARNGICAASSLVCRAAVTCQ